MLIAQTIQKGQKTIKNYRKQWQVLFANQIMTLPVQKINLDQQVGKTITA